MLPDLPTILRYTAIFLTGAMISALTIGIRLAHPPAFHAALVIGLATLAICGLIAWADRT